MREQLRIFTITIHDDSLSIDYMKVYTLQKTEYRLVPSLVRTVLKTSNHLQVSAFLAPTSNNGPSLTVHSQ